VAVISVGGQQHELRFTAGTMLALNRQLVHLLGYSPLLEGQDRVVHQNDYTIDQWQSNLHDR
jgi:hypothetical protein